MEINSVKELLKAFDESVSSYLEADFEGGHITLKKPDGVGVRTVAPMVPAPVVTAAPAANQEEKAQEPEEGEKVTAPLVGVFYAAPSPEEPAFVQVGDKVNAGDTLCLIEAMKMMSKIVAPKSGTVTKIYVKNQDVVGYEDPLFLIGD